MRNIVCSSIAFYLISICPSALAIQVDDTKPSGSFITTPDGKKLWMPSQLRADLTQNVSRKFPEAKLKIHKIEVQGNDLVSAEDILKVVTTKKGDWYVRERVVEDLKAIEQLDFSSATNFTASPCCWAVRYHWFLSLKSKHQLPRLPYRVAQRSAKKSV